MTYFLLALVAISCASLVQATIPFSIKNCPVASGESPAIEILATKVYTNPIPVPGKAKASGTIKVNKAPIAGKRYDVVFDVKKSTIFTWLHIPCIGGLGSCTFDMCNFLGERYRNGCPGGFGDHNLPCKCEDLKEGEYSFPITEFQIGQPNDPSVPSGDYRVEVKVQEHDTGAVKACFQLNMSLMCDGVLCNAIG